MKRIIQYFVKYPMLANAFIVFTIAIGMASLFALKRSFFPESRIKDIYIDVVNLGTSPVEMEEGVTIKIEESLKGVTGIDEVYSSTSENFSQVHLVTKKGYDIEEVLSDVKNAVDQINSFPDNAERPKVYKKKPLTGAIMLTLYGDVTHFELKKAADHLEDDFLNTGFISQLNIYGIPEMEISINVKEADLYAYGITINEIASIISRENRDISGGTIKTSNEELIIRSENKTTSTEKLKQLIIRSKPDGSNLTLGEIANINLKLAETSSSSHYNGKPSIAVRVNKLPEEDILQITDYIKEYIEVFNNKQDNVQLSVVYDFSVELKQRIDLLTKNGIIGLVLVLVVLGVFLNIRLALWTALGIPISFLGMLFIGQVIGITINQLSLFGMILVIGILVDDGIVIAENIYSHVEKGLTPKEAAIKGTAQVLPSVFTSVFTTIFAFGAFFFLDGKIGEFLIEMGIVVIASLGYSLLEASTILPAHLRDLKIPKQPSRFRKFVDGKMDYLRIQLYGKFVKFSIRYRWQMLSVPITFILILIGMLQGGHIRTSMFPFIDSDYIVMNLELKPGAREQQTKAILQKIDRVAWDINEIYKDSLNGNSIITSTRIDVNDNGNSGALVATLLGSEERNEILSTDLSNLIKKRMGHIPEAEKFTNSGRTFFGKPISITLMSKDIEALNHAKEDLEHQLANIPELTDIIDNNVIGKREIKIDLKPKAYALGLSHLEISSQIRNGFFGKEAQRLQIGSDEVKIWVRFRPEDRASLSQLDNLRIATPKGEQFPLHELVSYTFNRELTTIKHFNGAREVTIEASLVNPDTPLDNISDNIKTNIIPDLLAKYSTVSQKAGGQERERTKLFGSIVFVLPIVIVSIFLLLAVNFRSFAQPFIVLLMIPLGIYGAQLGPFIEGKSVVIMSYLGMVALAGVIVNDAVVFMDKFNENIRSGHKVGASIYEAGISRFRPILLTSITTVVGLYPLIFEQSRQAQFLIPMAITVAWGILIGTLFILLIFPAFIMILNDIRYARGTLYKGRNITRQEVEPAYKEIKDHDKK